jgi:hypothetical protein
LIVGWVAGRVIDKVVGAKSFVLSAPQSDQFLLVLHTLLAPVAHCIVLDLPAENEAVHMVPAYIVLESTDVSAVNIVHNHLVLRYLNEPDRIVPNRLARKSIDHLGNHHGLLHFYN